ncbi:MAG TPA: protein kinase, partial [Kofleriaceae bacterium]
ASVLDATHNAGITHRDLKPENVFLIPDREQPRGERVKVLDFGVAKLTGTLAGNSPRTFGTLGTPMYMAPEQWGDASQVDWRADLYSLGCVTYEMACGHPPFPVKTVAEACAKHLHEMPLLVSTQTDGIPPELDRLIAQLLEKAPERRPHAIRDVERAFVEIGRSIGVDGVAATMPVGSLPPHSDVIATVMSGAQPAVTQPKKRTPWLAAALVSVLAIGGASAYLIASRDKTSTEPKPTDAPKPAPVVTAIEPDASVPSHEELGVKIAQITAQPQTPARPQAGPRTVPPQSHANVMPKKIARDQQPPAAPPPVTDAPPTQPSSAELPPAPDMDAVKRGLLQGEKALDNCMTVNNVTTKQKLDITIGPVGRATAVAVSGVLANSEYESCVFTVLRSLSFPQSKHGTRFTVPVTPP